MPSNETALISDRRGRVCVLTLNRPDRKNALSPELVDALNRKLAELAAESPTPVLILRGAGDEAFCSGYDLAFLPAGRSGADSDERLNAVETLFQSVVDFSMPVIAMINGAAFGAGCELAVCCDIRVAADHARIGMPPSRLGLVYPWTGLRRFVQTIGLANTKEMLFTGRAYTGERLRELGLVERLAPREELEAVAFGCAEEMAANAPLALMGTKRILNLLRHAQGLDPPAMEEARSLVARSLSSADLQEGQRAFLEKRRPRFEGR
jgi:enoyl-CoA hydratase/carnithine racemase